jgi:hypothetical protein
MFGDVIAFLKDWKELVGAFIGAAGGVVAAFLAAYLSRRKEDISAAMVLVGNLTSVMGAHTTLKEIAEQQAVAEDDYPMWVAQRLVASRPRAMSHA